MVTDLQSIATSVSGKVLQIVKDIIDKQGDNKKPVCIDTIALIMHVKINDLIPLLEYMHNNGELIIHRNLSAKSKTTEKPFSVSLN